MSIYSYESIIGPTNRKRDLPMTQVLEQGIRRGTWVHLGFPNVENSVKKTLWKIRQIILIISISIDIYLLVCVHTYCLPTSSKRERPSKYNTFNQIPDNHRGICACVARGLTVLNISETPDDTMSGWMGLSHFFITSKRWFWRGMRINRRLLHDLYLNQQNSLRNEFIALKNL